MNNKAEKRSVAYDRDHSHTATYKAIVDDVSETALNRFQNIENDSNTLSEHLFDKQHHITQDPFYNAQGMIATAKTQIGKISVFCMCVCLYSALAFAILP